jgi:hypothetical protein
MAAICGLELSSRAPRGWRLAGQLLDLLKSKRRDEPSCLFPGHRQRLDEALPIDALLSRLSHHEIDSEKNEN